MTKKGGNAFVAGGLADCVLYELIPEEQSAFAALLFGNAGREHMKLFGTTREQIAKIAEKNHRHSVNNPYAQFQDEYGDVGYGGKWVVIGLGGAAVVSLDRRAA